MEIVNLKIALYVLLLVTSFVIALQILTTISLVGSSNPNKSSMQNIVFGGGFAVFVSAIVPIILCTLILASNALSSLPTAFKLVCILFATIKGYKLGCLNEALCRKYSKFSFAFDISFALLIAMIISVLAILPIDLYGKLTPDIAISARYVSALFVTILTFYIVIKSPLISSRLMCLTLLTLLIFSSNHMMLIACLSCIGGTLAVLTYSNARIPLTLQRNSINSIMIMVFAFNDYYYNAFISAIFATTILIVFFAITITNAISLKNLNLYRINPFTSECINLTQNPRAQVMTFIALIISTLLISLNLYSAILIIK